MRIQKTYAIQLTYMVNYRRNFATGGTYFFTVTLRDRHSQQLTRSIGVLRQAFRKTLHAQPFQIDAIVILPDHLHTIWTLPPGDMDYPDRWKAIKSNFSRGLAKSGIPVEERQDGSTFVWQRRYWEHTIRNNDDLNRHIDYIHINPVKRVADWPYSSFHRYVRQGLLPLDWASDVLSNTIWGEPDFDD